LHLLASPIVILSVAKDPYHSATCPHLVRISYFICNFNGSEFFISNCHPERLGSGAKDLALGTLQPACSDLAMDFDLSVPSVKSVAMPLLLHFATPITFPAKC
jgi:hypothetical protein